MNRAVEERIQLHPGDVHRRTISQGSHQLCRLSCGQFIAPYDHAGRAPTTYAQKFNWYMATALPTGDAPPFLFTQQMLNSSQCIIWIGLAVFADIPPVVSPFPPFDNSQLNVLQIFLILDLNGVSPRTLARGWC